MNLRNLCITTMLCTSFMANAGLSELKDALDRAQLASQSAFKKAEAYCNVGPARFYFEKGYAERARALVDEAGKAVEVLQAARAAYEAAQAIAARNIAFIDQFHRYDDEDNLIEWEDVTMTLEWEDDRKTDLVGAVQISDEGILTFAGKPADQDAGNQ